MTAILHVRKIFHAGLPIKKAPFPRTSTGITQTSARVAAEKRALFLPCGHGLPSCTISASPDVPATGLGLLLCKTPPFLHTVPAHTKERAPEDTARRLQVGERARLVRGPGLQGWEEITSLWYSVTAA